MASIVYVSDSRMIDFHRMNGSSSMNFWRLSDKKFTRFSSGDYLFFLDKKERKGKEKGLIGYGTCASIRSMSLGAMWKLYKEANGYATKEDLKQAIEKISKTKQVPKKLNCIFLSDVIFFQGPIFLSEFGIKLPTSLESFTYLERDGKDITSELLVKSRLVGIDVWTRALNANLESSSIEEDIVLNDLSTLFQENFIFHPQSDSKLERRGIDGYQTLKQCPGILYQFEKTTIHLAIPILTDRGHKEEHLFSRVMQVHYLLKKYKKEQPYTYCFYGRSLNKYKDVFELLGETFISID